MYISGSVGMARCHTLLQLANKYHFFPIFLLHFKKIVYLCTRKKRECGNSSVGRAQPCQGWGRGFKSRLPLFSNSLIVFVRTGGRNAAVFY